MNSKPLLLTPGEPAGIGPDLAILLAQNHRNRRIVTIADPSLLKQRANDLGLPLKIFEYSESNNQENSQPGSLEVFPVSLCKSVTPGVLNPDNARYVLQTLDRAVELCLKGDAVALVTGPVHKGNINDAGITFSGHTEYLADLTGGYPVMMLATPGLRVGLVTTHLPLAEVSGTITANLVEKVVRILWNDLHQRFGIADPQILVCGLNPHAGEGGHMGHEEIEVIEPVLNGLREEGMSLHGPAPADTAFTDKALKNKDAVLAMYHDQGLPVLKYKGFGKAVNVTLGLPMVRTSVDHGTALELAGTGKADMGSLEYALQVAAEMTGLDGLELIAN